MVAKVKHQSLMKNVWFWMIYLIMATLVLWSMCEDFLAHDRMASFRTVLMVGFLWMYSGVGLGWDMAKMRRGY